MVTLLQYSQVTFLARAYLLNNTLTGVTGPISPPVVSDMISYTEIEPEL